MLFATLDPTTRKVVLPKRSLIPSQKEFDNGRLNKGQEVLLTDTVGFISKLPTDLIAAFRATLEEVQNADVLIHVCDRSSPVWKKQRETVLKELDNIGCYNTPIVELWNKIDALPNADDVMLEAASMPIDVEIMDDLVSVEMDNLQEGQSELLHVEALSKFDEESNFDEENEILSRDVDEITSGPSTVKRIPDGVRDSFRPQRRIFTVAASALTGLGFDDFLSTLEDSLSLLLRPTEVFIPYDKDDGVIARIFSQGSVDEVEYKNSGTRIVCRVPEALYMKLGAFRS